MDFQSLFDDVEYEFRMIVKTVGEQITTPSRSHRSTREEPNFYFTTRFYRQAKEFNLTETDAIEVYNTGQELNEETIARAYNGYEIGIEYTTELHSGKPLITSIWKRE